MSKQRSKSKRIKDLCKKTARELKQLAKDNGITGPSTNAKKWWAEKLVEIDADLSSSEASTEPEQAANRDQNQDRNHNRRNRKQSNRNDQPQRPKPRKRNKRKNRNNRNDDNENESKNEDEMANDNQEISVDGASIHVDCSYQGLDAYLSIHKWRSQILKNQQALSDLLEPEFLKILTAAKINLDAKSKEALVVTVRGTSGPQKAVKYAHLPKKATAAQRNSWLSNRRDKVEKYVDRIVAQIDGGAVVTLVDIQAILAGKPRMSRVTCLGELRNVSRQSFDILTDQIQEFVDKYCDQKRKKMEDIKVKAQICDTIQEELDKLNDQKDDMDEEEFNKRELQIYRSQMLFLGKENKNKNKNKKKDHDKEEEDYEDEEDEEEEKDTALETEEDDILGNLDNDVEDDFDDDENDNDNENDNENDDEAAHDDSSLSENS